MTRTLGQILVATIALLISQAALAGLVPASARQVAIGVPIAVTSTMLTVSVLLLVAVHARDTGGRLALMLFGLWGGIQAIYLIEAVVFDIGVPRADQPWLFAHALSSALAAGLAVALTARTVARPPGPPLSHARLPWLELLGCGAIYTALYIAAGLVIAWPVVEPYYRERPMPSPGLVFPLQVVRGAAFGLVMLLLVRRTRTDRLKAGLIGGLVLSVLGGVAPLLLPNAYMPDVVRLAHLAEVAVSNFLFGLIAAWWLWAEEGQQAR